MPKLDIFLRNSLYFMGLQVGFFVMSLVIILALPLTIWLKILLILLTTAYAVYLFHQFHGKHAIRSIHLDQDRWSVRTQMGETLAHIEGESTLTALVLILRFKTADSRRKRTAVIFRDALPAESYRRLVVSIRNAT